MSKFEDQHPDVGEDQSKDDQGNHNRPGATSRPFVGRCTQNIEPLRSSQVALVSESHLLTASWLMSNIIVPHTSIHNHSHKDLVKSSVPFSWSNVCDNRNVMKLFGRKGTFESAQWTEKVLVVTVAVYSSQWGRNTL
eukprot:6460033-Amphidinium_carterae.3